MEQPLWPRTMPEPHEVDRLFAQVFALVGEGIAGATHTLLAGVRDAAKELVERDEVIDKLIGQISTTVQHQLVHGGPRRPSAGSTWRSCACCPTWSATGTWPSTSPAGPPTVSGPRCQPAVAASSSAWARSRPDIWRETADAFAERSSEAAALIDDLDDELDDLHVTLTAELVAGTMPLPVAVEMAMVAGFYERFGDHAVDLARRLATLVVGVPSRCPPAPIDPASPGVGPPASPAPPERRAGLAYPAIPTIGALSGWPPREP